MENKQRIFTVLSIAGGGVRGVIPLRILQEIEDRTGTPIAKLFDMIGGISTGSIIGGGLSIPDPKDPTQPRLTAKNMLGFYNRLAPKVFPKKRFKMLHNLSSGGMYDPTPLEDSLKEVCGDLKMRDTLTSLMVPTTDIKNFKPVWITHLKGEKDSSEEGWHTMLLRDAIRAGTSAPTYFKAGYYETTPNEAMPHVKQRHALIDGGLFGGNAIRHLVTEARKIAPPDAQIVVIHLGTGKTQNGMSPDEFNKITPLGLVTKGHQGGLFAMLFDMPAMDIENDLKNEIGERFFSFNGNIDDDDSNAPSQALDDASPENMKLLHDFAEKIIRDNHDTLDRLCTVLKSRAIAEERHLESHAAFQGLASMMDEAKTKKTLLRLYTKITHYNVQIPKPGPDDDKIRELAGKMSEHHKEAIHRMYIAKLHTIQNSPIMNAFRTAGEDIREGARKIFIEPFKDDPAPPPPPPPPPPPVNDNPAPPPVAEPKKKKRGGKKGPSPK